MTTDDDTPPWPRLAAQGDPARLDSDPPELRHQSAHDLWIALSDPIYSIAIDRSGGTPLFTLPEDEAMVMLRHWWRYHRARYLAHLAVERRRREIRSVQATTPPENTT